MRATFTNIYKCLLKAFTEQIDILEKNPKHHGKGQEVHNMFLFPHWVQLANVVSLVKAISSMLQLYYSVTIPWVLLV